MVRPRYRPRLCKFKQVAIRSKLPFTGRGFTTYSCFDSGLIFFGDYEESATFTEGFIYARA